MIRAVPAAAPTAIVRRELLAGLIDHAPLFPPASMGLGDALAADARARGGAEAWMRVRFICPATKLEELVEAAGGAHALPALSVVVDCDVHVGLGEAAASGARVELVELRASRSDDLREAVDRALGGHVTIYVEGADPGSLGQGLGAKVRCGGATADAFPPPEAVAEFVARCVRAGVPFKATAGLHHAIRHGEAHGFLNLLAAAVFAHADGLGEDELVPLLAEEDPAAFALDADGLAVHGHHADAAAIAEARAELFVAYGSCSFDEPVEDLTSLGALARCQGYDLDITGMLG
jgi:hypothetical protein